MLATQRREMAALKDELRLAFTELEQAVISEDYEAAYRLTAESYRKQTSLSDFSSRFSSIEPLGSTWTIRKEEADRVRICCSHPGVSFSPSSTMTYVFVRASNDSRWRFSGESEMWLD